MVVTIYSRSEGFMNHLLWEIHRVSMEYLWSHLPSIVGYKWDINEVFNDSMFSWDIAWIYHQHCCICGISTSLITVEVILLWGPWSWPSKIFGTYVNIKILEENRKKYGDIYGYIPFTIYLWIYFSLGNIPVSFGNFWELAWPSWAESGRAFVTAPGVHNFIKHLQNPAFRWSSIFLVNSPNSYWVPQLFP